MTGPLYKTRSYGGGGGTAFDDTQAMLTTNPVGFSRISVSSGSYLDRLAPTYKLSNGTTYAPSHGGTGGAPASADFLSNEVLIGIQGRSGDLVDQLGFMTAIYFGGGDPPSQKTYGPFGGGGGDTGFTIWGQIAAFYGRSGSYVDAIGCYLSNLTIGPFGGGGGSAFEDPAPVPELGRMVSITVYSDDHVNSLATTYVLPDGSTQTFSHGKADGTRHDIIFNPGEHIIVALGRSGSLVDNICFLTEDPQGVRRTFGPYGGQGGTQFICNEKVGGFFGRSGSSIDAIGFFVG